MQMQEKQRTEDKSENSQRQQYIIMLGLTHDKFKKGKGTALTVLVFQGLCQQPLGSRTQYSSPTTTLTAKVLFETSCNTMRWLQGSAIIILHQTRGVLLQPLGWCCVDCVIHHERDVREEQRPYICGANKQ